MYVFLYQEKCLPYKIQRKQQQYTPFDGARRRTSSCELRLFGGPRCALPSALVWLAALLAACGSSVAHSWLLLCCSRSFFLPVAYPYTHTHAITRDAIHHVQVHTATPNTHTLSNANRLLGFLRPTNMTMMCRLADFFSVPLLGPLSVPDFHKFSRVL